MATVPAAMSVSKVFKTFHPTNARAWQIEILAHGAKFKYPLNELRGLIYLILAQAEEMKIPCLETYLSKIFATATSSKDNVCEYCNYAAKNTRALSAHYRGCEHRKTHVTSLAVNTMVPNKGPGK